MITQFWEYKGIKFYPAWSTALTCKTLDNTWVNLVLSNQIKQSTLRTATFQNQNNHWSYTSRTLWSWRLFTFKGSIYWTKAQRQEAMDYLNNVMQPEGLFIDTEWFYTLTWQDYSNREFKTEAKVYWGVKYSHDIWSPVIEFSFELYSNEFEYLSTTEQTWTWWIARMWWVNLWTTLWTTLSWVIWSFTVINWWNFEAWCKVRIQWTLENPKMTNLTNGTSYYLEWITTTDLVVDNRWTDFIVEDNSVNVEQYRSKGSTIMLSKWSNEIFVTWDNYEIWNTVVVTVTWNDTYTNN